MIRRLEDTQASAPAEIEFASPRSRSLYRQSREAVARRDFATACKLLSRLVRQEPRSPRAHYALSVVQSRLGDIAGAMASLRVVEELAPLHAGAAINLGALYHRIGDNDRAIRYLRRAIQLDPERWEGHYNIGLVYRRQGLTSLALSSYRESLRRKPNLADAAFNVGNIYLAEGEFEQAKAYYRRALEIAPNFARAREGLARAEGALHRQKGEQASAPKGIVRFVKRAAGPSKIPTQP